LIFNVRKPNTLTRKGYVIPASTVRYGCWCKRTETNLIQLAHLTPGDIILDEEGQTVKITPNGILITEGAVTKYEIDVEPFHLKEKEKE
jgi:hypothetical protein